MEVNHEPGQRRFRYRLWGVRLRVRCYLRSASKCLNNDHHARLGALSELRISSRAGTNLGQASSEALTASRAKQSAASCHGTSSTGWSAMIPVRPSCQELRELADSGDVFSCSCRHKMVCFAGCPQITGVLGAEGAVSLSQANSRNSNPVRPENSQSCQAVIA